jgi:hypothetical protein
MVGARQNYKHILNDDHLFLSLIFSGSKHTLNKDAHS